MGRSFHDSPYQNRPKRQRASEDKHLLHRHERRVARRNPAELEDLEGDSPREQSLPDEPEDSQEA